MSQPSTVKDDFEPKATAGDLADALPEVADLIPYPLEALGDLLGNAARAIAAGVQAPDELAAQSVLAVAGFAAQDKANIAIDGRKIPLSLFLITVAASGDRKTATDKVASAPLHEWQRNRFIEHAENVRIYNDALAVYEAEHREIIGTKKKSSVEKNADLNNLQQPERLPEPIVLCQEPTLEGLQLSFRNGSPSQALFNDEGGQFFGGHAMNTDNAVKTIAGLSKYWDGAPIIRTRAGKGESVAMYDRRLSIHLQAQPRIADVVLSDPLLLDQGLLARFLVSSATSLAGTREYKNSNPLAHPAVIKFHAVITRLLNHAPATVEGGGLDLPDLLLNDDAMQIWIDRYNGTEFEQAPGAALEVVKPAASKAADNALRLAGVFAVLEGSPEVTGDQMERAWCLAIYYLQNALRTAQLSEINAAQRSANDVLEWIKSKSPGAITIGEMQKTITPAKYRKSVSQIRAIMAGLSDAGRVMETRRNGKGEASEWRLSL